MEIFRFKKEKFNLENFIHYYNDNMKNYLWNIHTMYREYA